MRLKSPSTKVLRIWIASVGLTDAEPRSPAWPLLPSLSVDLPWVVLRLSSSCRLVYLSRFLSECLLVVLELRLWAQSYLGGCFPLVDVRCIFGALACSRPC